MTEEIFILDCHSDIFVWVGQQVDAKNRLNALTIGQVYFLLMVLVMIDLYLREIYKKYTTSFYTNSGKLGITRTRR